MMDKSYLIPEKENSMGERIQKRISASGLMSRRAAETAIASGRVTINGRTACPGESAEPEDVICGFRPPRRRGRKSGTTYIRR